MVFAESEYHDVHLEFVTEKLDDTPEDRLLASGSSYVAAIEREKIRERTIRGKWAKAEVSQGRSRPGAILGTGSIRLREGSRARHSHYS